MRPRPRLALALAAMAIVATLAIGLAGYIRTRALVEADARDRLTELLKITAAGIDAEAHRAVHDEADRGSPAYAQLVGWLERVKSASPAIAFVYTQRRIGDRLQFVVDPTRPIGSDFAEVTAEQLAHYADPVYLEPLRDRRLIGTVPIVGKAGQDGVVGIDLEVDRLEEARYAHVWIILIGGALLAACGVLVGWLSARRACAAPSPSATPGRDP